jgi:regulator of sigma E protease
MSGFLGATFWFIVTLGVLVTIHEFGHFWVARRCGVQVLKFSVGFGRPLWSRVAADGTRYQIAMVPLGGYVQFLDERETEVAPAQQHLAFNRQPVGRRIAIVLAGPLANLVLCVALLWGAFLIGLPGTVPMVGKVDGLAQASGLRAGDRIVAVDGVPVQTWDQLITPLALAAIDHRALPLQVQDVAGLRSDKLLRLDRLAADFDQARPLQAAGLGVGVGELDPVVGHVEPGSPAEGQLRAGDRIVSLDARPVARWADIPAIVRTATPGRALDIVLLRDGQQRRLALTPHLAGDADHPVLQVGISPAIAVALRKYGPSAALGAAWQQTRTQTRETLAFLGRLVTGKASSKNLSGAIGIAQAANAEASLGLARLLAFMASLSLMLFVMNLLPIPVLDGGHLLYYLIELVSGRPVGERVLIAGQYAGLLVLASLLGLAFYNDLVRTIT